MPKSKPITSLQAFMAIGQLQRVTQKELLGGEYVRAGDFWSIMGSLYTFWALIGRTFNDDAASVMRLLDVPPENESKFTSLLRNMVDERLQRYHQIHGQDPDAFCALIVDTEYAKSGLNLESGTLGSIDETKAFEKRLKQAAKGKVDIRNVNVWRRVEMVGAEGIGFGLLYPDLTWDIVTRQYKLIDVESDDWKTFRSLMQHAGRSIPEEAATYSAKQAETDALEFLSLYIRHVRFELTGMLRRLDTGCGLT